MRTLIFATLLIGACSSTPDTLSQFRDAGFSCVDQDSGWECTKCDRINPRTPSDKLFSTRVYCEAYTFKTWTW